MRTQVDSSSALYVTSHSLSVALKPFHRDDRGNFWTSNSIRDHTIFGYTYPDLIGIFNSTNTTLSRRGVPSALVARVNALYGPNASPLQSRQPLKRSISALNAPHLSGERQYTLNVQVQEFRDPGALKVYAFFGRVEGRIEDWPQETGFIGVTSILAASKNTLWEAHSVIPLTPALEARAREGKLKSLGENDVAQYLRKHLRWRVVKVCF